jgi:hypothetical protein
MIRTIIFAIMLTLSTCAFSRVYTSSFCSNCPRDKHGHIKHSTAAKDEFRTLHPCPSTGKKSGACPGYVIDHIKAIKLGGIDSPSNLQWETIKQRKLRIEDSD